jgi:hypothetical protein
MRKMIEVSVWESHLILGNRKYPVILDLGKEAG